MHALTLKENHNVKKVAIVQSNYLPWKGYFDLIGLVDEFILYDSVQYTRRDWRNRNLIKTPQGLQWLTIPVVVGGKYHQRIDETRISDPEWNVKHWKALAHAYRRSPYFEAYRARLECLFLDCRETYLSKINHRFLVTICDILGIATPLACSTQYPSQGDDKTERLVGLCRAAGASVYLSGPAARNYLSPELFAAAGIELRYMDYSGYPEYPQFHGTFEHGVTILDLLFQCGPTAPHYMKFPRG